MADNRMYLRCRLCQAEFRLATYSAGGPWDAYAFTQEALNEWFAEHGSMRHDGSASEHEGRDDDWSNLDRLDQDAGRWYEITYE